MQQRRVLAVCGAAALLAAALTAPADAGGATAQARGARAVGSGHQDSYLVLTRTAAGARPVAAKLRSRGVTVTSVNDDIGVIGVRSADAGFRRTARAIAGVQGVAADRVIGQAPDDSLPRGTAPQGTGRKLNDAVEHEKAPAGSSSATSRAKAPATKYKGTGFTGDPLDGYLWGMRMIKADRAHAKTLGNPKVKVGVMDTGVDASHPDLHANFDYDASRNFTTDIPYDTNGNLSDGPCEVASCIDPVGTDDNGHGTHVAGTMAAAADGFGLSGVAPRARIVEVRAGQDSGNFFSLPTINAIAYSGAAGLDVVNMSFYVDPWLYNCRGGAPEDTAEQAADQDTIITGVSRALKYAHRMGVTLVASAGNNHENLASPRVDVSSPDFPLGAAHSRTIDNASCKVLPVEGPHVLGITSLGPSGKKSDFSNYTSAPRSGEVELSAPGGWLRDFFGTPQHRVIENEILSTAPLNVMRVAGNVDADGNITPQGEAVGIRKECTSDGTCGYYQWLQGTSMASPHAAGVAALAVGAHGHRIGRSGFGMAPDRVAWLLGHTATNHACPAGGVQSYLDEGRDDSFTATCVGTTGRNGFYGEGIVNAWGAVR